MILYAITIKYEAMLLTESFFLNNRQSAPTIKPAYFWGVVGFLVQARREGGVRRRRVSYPGDRDVWEPAIISPLKSFENVGAVGGRNFGLSIDLAHHLYSSLLLSHKPWYKAALFC